MLVNQLNRSGSDLPSALITRWLAWIRLFDFEVRHIPGKKHTAADGLSRRPRAPDDTSDEESVDEFIAQDLGIFRLSAQSSRSSETEEIEEGFGDLEGV